MRIQSVGLRVVSLAYELTSHLSLCLLLNNLSSPIILRFQQIVAQTHRCRLNLYSNLRSSNQQMI